MFTLPRSWTVRDKVRAVLSLMVGALVAYLCGNHQAGLLLADNSPLTISMITYKALEVLENNLTFTKRINRQLDNRSGVDGAKIGTVLNVRKPIRPTVSVGTQLDIQDFVETSVPVAMDTQLHVGMAFTSAERLLSIDDFGARVIAPQISVLANKVDYLGLQQYKNIYNTVGTPATIPILLLTYLLAGASLDNNAAPMDNQRSIVINPLMQVYIVDALKGLFQKSDEIARQYVKGTMGTAAGFDWFMDQNTPVHTVGPLGGTPLVNGANQTGASLITDAWTNTSLPRLNQGDTFTLPGVYGVNPESRISTGVLQSFVVTADMSDTSGAMTIPIDPPIVIAGQFQTVTASPADNAALTINGAANAVTPQGLAFHKDAFTMVSADLPLPGGLDRAARASDDQLGISMTILSDFDIFNYRYVTRVDILLGWATLRPELACRIAA